MNHVILNVEGMSCSHCVKAVSDAVMALDGVAGVNVSLEKKTAAVDYDAEKVSLESIKEAIEEEGYEVV
jgi:copper chaperone